MNDLTLNETLDAMGLHTRPGDVEGTKDILDADGDVLFTGRAWQVWVWIHSMVDPRFDEVKEVVVALLDSSAQHDGRPHFCHYTLDMTIVRNANGTWRFRHGQEIQEFDDVFDAAFALIDAEHRLARALSDKHWSTKPLS